MCKPQSPRALQMRMCQRPPLRGGKDSAQASLVVAGRTGEKLEKSELAGHSLILGSGIVGMKLVDRPTNARPPDVVCGPVWLTYPQDVLHQLRPPGTAFCGPLWMRRPPESMLRKKTMNEMSLVVFEVSKLNNE